MTIEKVRSVADLARIELTAEEEQRITEALQAVLKQTEALKQVNTEQVEPTIYVRPLQNVFREDEVQEGLVMEEVLANAPETENGCFKVPRIL
ncbi:MAG TPA: Asp-tRNA(Asn)/Glu-tRNA(Gln) amidotransferase subunit GatC [Peptococcaceae bacterium]|nr:Asp-tRNA(Asn)/Glu-tRNA(Gln) amidotransferase subunit GatC [Peptococcaceae bacterium]